MNGNSTDTKTNLQLLKIDSVVETFSTLIKQGEETIVTFFNSNKVYDAMDKIDTLSEDLSEALKVVNTIRKIASIPDKLFMRKLELYCTELVSIPVSKREKYVEKVGKKSLSKDSVFILGVLNKTEELSKINIFIKLFKAKIDEEINDQTYRRMMLQVERTMFSDILFLKDNICNNEIKITSVEEENLLATGWLIFAGIGISTNNEDGGTRYLYTQTAKQFCNIVFQISPMINNNNIGTISFDTENGCSI